MYNKSNSNFLTICLLAAFSSIVQLARRQVEGKSVSVVMMNLVLRGLALQGAVEQCGRLFEEYQVCM
jgi:hypothetical protein